MRAHRIEATVITLNDRIRNIKLESLKAHYLLFYSIFGDQPVNVDRLFLTDPMGAIHCLKVHLRVPIMLDENNSVGTG